MTGLYDRLFMQLGPPVLDFVSSYRSSLENLRVSQFLPPDELRRRQENHFRQLCEYAFRHVPLFKKLGGVPKFRDPAELPILSKSILRRHPHLAVSAGERSVYRRHACTSGTAGVPLEFWTDRRSDGHRLASRYLFDEWIGLPLGCRTVRMMAHPNRFSRLLANEMHVPLVSLNSGTAETLLGRLLEFQPEGIVGQPYSLGLLAEAKLRNKLKPCESLHCMVATEENLLGSVRRSIENAFQCELYKRYGLREVSGYVAQECKAQRGLHVNVEHFYVEIVQDGQVVSDGKLGRIVITDLHNRVMPFIRYDTEDVGVLSRHGCTCGITWPLLETVQGRQSDYIFLRNNTRVPIGIFADKFLHSFTKKVAQIQLREDRQGFVLVRIVPENNFTPRDMVQVKDYFSRFLSSFDVERVDRLPSVGSGKTPLLVRE